MAIQQIFLRSRAIKLLLGLMLALLIIPLAHADTAPPPPLKQILSTTIDGYPQAVRGLLREIVLADGFTGVISQQQAQAIGNQLGLNPQQTALALIKLARAYAKPPISHYQVGAVAIGSSGTLYFGCNLEFPGQALSFSVHAEQSATMNAWMHGETGLKAIAITAAPCGYCRQFLNELTTASTLDILLQDAPAIALRTLLPKPFGPGDLGMKGGLMQAENQKLKLQPAAQTPLEQAALAAASSSYAPYSGNYAGLALESSTGLVAAGRYAENAAYSPSMSPLQAALSQYNLAGKDFSQIKRAVLVQTDLNTANQEDVSKAALWAIAPKAKLEILHASSPSQPQLHIRPRTLQHGTTAAEGSCEVKH